MTAPFIPKNLREESPTNQEVLKLASWMEHKLSKNRHKGDREGWLKAPIAALVRHLDEEVAELKRALESDKGYDIMCEAADVANLAMMVADKACWDIEGVAANGYLKTTRRHDCSDPKPNGASGETRGD